ncbi:hypothetical protein M8J77_013589 [Diaphorina citri]|nr:hypothetical protein M8J77_013589 [Diaphorina citri]
MSSLFDRLFKTANCDKKRFGMLYQSFLKSKKRTKYQTEKTYRIKSKSSLIDKSKFLYDIPDSMIFPNTAETDETEENADVFLKEFGELLDTDYYVPENVLLLLGLSHLIENKECETSDQEKQLDPPEKSVDKNKQSTANKISNDKNNSPKLPGKSGSNTETSTTTTTTQKKTNNFTEILNEINSLKRKFNISNDTPGTSSQKLKTMKLNNEISNNMKSPSLKPNIVNKSQLSHSSSISPKNAPSGNFEGPKDAPKETSSPSPSDELEIVFCEPQNKKSTSNKNNLNRPKSKVEHSKTNVKKRPLHTGEANVSSRNNLPKPVLNIIGKQSLNSQSQSEKDKSGSSPILKPFAAVSQLFNSLNNNHHVSHNINKNDSLSNRKQSNQIDSKLLHSKKLPNKKKRLQRTKDTISPNLLETEPNPWWLPGGNNFDEQVNENAFNTPTVAPMLFSSPTHQIDNYQCQTDFSKDLCSTISSNSPELPISVAEKMQDTAPDKQPKNLMDNHSSSDVTSPGQSGIDSVIKSETQCSDTPENNQENASPSPSSSNNRRPLIFLKDPSLLLKEPETPFSHEKTVLSNVENRTLTPRDESNFPACLSEVLERSGNSPRPTTEETSITSTSVPLEVQKSMLIESVRCNKPPSLNTNSKDSSPTVGVPNKILRRTLEFNEEIMKLLRSQKSQLEQLMEIEEPCHKCMRANEILFRPDLTAEQKVGLLQTIHKPKIIDRLI